MFSPSYDFKLATHIIIRDNYTYLLSDSKQPCCIFISPLFTLIILYSKLQPPCLFIFSFLFSFLFEWLSFHQYSAMMKLEWLRCLYFEFVYFFGILICLLELLSFHLSVQWWNVYATIPVWCLFYFIDIFISASSFPLSPSPLLHSSFVRSILKEKHIFLTVIYIDTSW